MTGYSRATRQTPYGVVTVELRSTNHRYLEVDQRLPEGLGGFEGELVQLMRGQLRRGRVEVIVSLQPHKAATKRVMFDEALAEAYYKTLLQVKSRFGLRGEVTLDHLLANPSILSARDEKANRQEAWPAIRQVIQAALKELLAMRRSEGRRLVRDIQSQARGIGERAARIHKELPKSIAMQKRRLGERLKQLLGNGAGMSSGQVQQALALVKDVDIHEELVRLESHLAHMQQALKSADPIGKKLDFISQELMREANTMAAKANDATLVRYCIEIKGAIEKIREQAQNLE